MVPCSCGGSEVPLDGSQVRDDRVWLFGFDLQRLPRTHWTLATLLAMVATLSVGLTTAHTTYQGLCGAFFGISWVVMLVCVATRFLGPRSSRDSRLIFSPTSACRMGDGQQALRLTALHLHPLCAVITFCAHDPQVSQKRFSLVLWRHHYPRDQFRRITLALRWLSTGARA